MRKLRSFLIETMVLVVKQPNRKAFMSEAVWAAFKGKIGLRMEAFYFTRIDQLY